MTAPFLRMNFSEGLLAADLGKADLELTVQEGHTLPSTMGEFRITIYSSSYSHNPSADPSLEMLTASYSGTPNVYRIVRAQETTEACSHTCGDKVSLSYTAGVSRDDLCWLGNHRLDDSGAAEGKILNLSNGQVRYTDSPTLQDLNLTKPSSIYKLEHNKFAGYDASKHVDHTSVSIVGADGCGGGGSITRGRTITNTDKGSVARAAHEAAFDHANFLLVEKDPVFMLSAAAGISKADIKNWNAAFAAITAHLSKKDSEEVA